MPPSRTATGVGARAALSAMACASFSSSSPMQPAGHGRRGEPGYGDAVPHGVRLPSAPCRGRKFRSRAGLRRGGRGRRARASSAAASATGILSLGWPPRAPLMRMGADHVVVEVEHADQRAVGEHGARRAHLHAHGRAPCIAAARRAPSSVATTARALSSSSAANPQPIVSSRTSLACSMALCEKSSLRTPATHAAMRSMAPAI